MLAHLQRIHILATLSTLVVLMAIPCPVNSQYQIININSRSNNQSNPVNVFLEAGTYQVEPIGTADGGAFNAWNPWSSTSCINPDGCQRTSPTTVTGWMNYHLVMSSEIVAVTIEGTPGSIDPTIPGYRVDDGFVYPTAIIALANAQSSVFALSSSGDVGFAIPDSPLWDNAGGMSLRITQASTLSIFPKTGGDTGFVSVYIFGSGFEEGAAVRLTRDGEADIFGEPVTVSENGALINTTFDLTGKTRGLWDVVITNPDSTISTLPEGFSIETGRSPELWMDILGSQFIRPEREQTHWINYGNKGNVDVLGAHLFLSIPEFVEYKFHSDGVLRNQPDQSISYFVTGRIAAGSSHFMPLILKISSDAPNFKVSSAISDNSEGLLIEHSSTYQNDLIPLTPIEHPIGDLPFTLLAASSQQNSPNCPDPDAFFVGDSSEAAQAPTGYVDYFVVIDPSVSGGKPFVETAIRIEGDVAWSYPGEGINRRSYDSFNFYNGNGTFINSKGETVYIRHAFSIRPFVDMDGVASKMIERWPILQATGWGFCSPSKWCKPSDPPDCKSCIACIQFVVNMLYGNEKPPWVPDANIPYEESDALQYWLGPKVNDCPGEAYFGPVDNPDWYKDWVNREKEELNKFIVVSRDPNDKIGSRGFGEEQYLSGLEPLRYAIFFENLETATAPAQEVIITDQLDVDKIDLQTLSLGPITFSGNFITPLAGQSTFSRDVDLRPDNNLIVHINVTMDHNTGILSWRFISIDPETGLPPEDPLAGFLPPNNNPPEGDGSVLFTVMPKAGLTTGTEISNSANIVFDTNEPIETPEWMNTIDNTKPDSQVLSLPSTQNKIDFEVQWTGTDEGAGIKDYTIFVSEDGGSYAEWLTNTPDISGTFSGENGKTYAFYSVARDQTNNIENAPEAPDTATTVVTNQSPVAQCKNVTVPTDPSTCVAATASVDNGSSEPDEDPITLDQSPPGPYPLGATEVTLTVTDDKGASDSCNATVTVLDQEPSVINNLAANPNVLWPPNHKMRPVTVAADASDNCDSDPVCKIISVSSNEPVNGTGDGDKSPDWEITGDLTVNLRAERTGSGSGRVYKITVGCTDDIGNSATAEATVTVPHNQ